MPVGLLEVIKPEPISEHAEQFFVVMRDGVRLATDVYLPARPMRHPAVLVRTPYDKASRYTALGYEARFYTERGYAFVAQDVRGKFCSEGETLPYHYDVQDAYDTIDWIVSQRWSDGTVGLTGASYYGFTTWAGVASGHPGVRAAIPRVTGVDMGARHIGSLWTQEVPNLLGLNDLLQIWTDNDGYLLDVDYSSAPVIELLEEVQRLLGPCKAVPELIARARTGEYYDAYGARHPYHTTTVPILHCVNWFDPGLAPLGMADWRHFRGLPGRRDQHFLRGASADHSGFLLSDVGCGDERNPYLSDATLDEMLAVECNEAIDFFDEHVRGNRPQHQRNRARWHVGHDDWHDSEEWPPDSSHAERLFLTPIDGAGALSTKPEPSTKTVRWTHDPQNPVPSTTSIEEVWYFLAAYPDERQLSERADVVTFTSECLQADLDIAGRPVLRAEVMSSGPSVHLFATVQDVLPDGTTRPVSWGNVATRSIKEEATVLPMSDIAYRFRAGHRVQLQVRSSNFPNFLVHPGTDENPWFAPARSPAEQSLRAGGQAGASLTLPVLDAPSDSGDRGHSVGMERLL